MRSWTVWTGFQAKKNNRRRDDGCKQKQQRFRFPRCILFDTSRSGTPWDESGSRCTTLMIRCEFIHGQLGFLIEREKRDSHGLARIPRPPPPHLQFYQKTAEEKVTSHSHSMFYPLPPIPLATTLHFWTPF